MTLAQHRIGIIGCGVVSTGHAQAVDKLPNAQLVAVTDVDPARAAEFAREHRTVALGLEQLLTHDEIDVVCICVPSGLHAELGVRAAAAGKHLVVEKPIDVSLAAADRLLAAVEGAGVMMTVISQHRFDPGVVELGRLLADGALGELILGDAAIKWYRSQQYYDGAGWRGTWELDGGGALMNQGIHYTELLRWIMGPVESVTAHCRTAAHQIEVEDVAAALLRFRSGAVGTLEATTAAFPGHEERLEISGTGGTAIVIGGRLETLELIAERPDVGDYGGAISTRGSATAGDGSANGGSGASDPAAIGHDAHALQIADLLDAIDEGREPLVTGQHGRDALELVCAVYESARSGQTVTLAAGADVQAARR